MKQMAIDAVNAQVLANVTYGTVIQTNPLKVQIDAKLILDEVHLEVVQSLSDYTIEMESPSNVRQQFTVYNALKNGDKVAMIRFQGGRRYLVVDRV